MLGGGGVGISRVGGNESRISRVGGMSRRQAVLGGGGKSEISRVGARVGDKQGWGISRRLARA